MPAIFVKAHEVRKDGPLALIVPKDLRARLNIGKHSRFVAQIEGKAIVFTPVPPEAEPEQTNGSSE